MGRRDKATLLKPALVATAYALFLLTPPPAAGGVIAWDADLATGDPWQADLSSITVGDAVVQLDFTGFTLADVTASAITANEVLAGPSWRLKNGPVTITFSEQLESFGFAFSGLKNAGIDVGFGTLATASIDGKTTASGTLRFDAAVGESFDTVTITWTKGAGDDVILDTIIASEVTAPVPGPAAAALFTLGGLAMIKAPPMRFTPRGG